MNRVLLVCVSVLAVLAMVATSAAGTILTGDVKGNFPYNAEVYTTNPWSGSTANAGLTETRQVGQTFQSKVDVDVNEIAFSFDVTGGASEGTNAVGLTVQLYEVDDVLAGSIDTAALTPLKEWAFPGVLPAGDFLWLTLTDDDVFTLPARNTGTEGYLLRLTTVEHDIDNGNGNPGTLVYSKYDNPYPPGTVYRNTSSATAPMGTVSSAYDAGIAINHIPEPSTLCLLLVALFGLAATRR
jgi:hypothetical protein